MTPLLALVGLLVVALVVLVPVKGCPPWVLGALFVLVVLTVLCFLGAYGYLVVRNPDALRTEKFHLRKLAIEKNLIGDSLTGLRDVTFVEPAAEHLALPLPDDDSSRKEGM